MKITISGAGGGEFRVQHANREDLVVSSSLSGAQAVEKVAEWLAVVPANPKVDVVEMPDGSRLPAENVITVKKASK